MQRALQGLVRLTWNEETAVRDAPEALRRKLAAALECTGFGELEDRLRATQERGLQCLPGAHRRAGGEGLTLFYRLAGRAPAHPGLKQGHTKEAGTGPERIRPVPAKWVLPAGWESRD